MSSVFVPDESVLLVNQDVLGMMVQEMAGPERSDPVTSSYHAYISGAVPVPA